MLTPLGLANGACADPSRVMLRITTTSADPALTLMAFEPNGVIPDNDSPPSIVTDFVIAIGPKLPASIASISPPERVFVSAPAHDLHGAVRRHAFASSPTPEIQERRLCAAAGVASAMAMNGTTSTRTPTDS